MHPAQKTKANNGFLIMAALSLPKTHPKRPSCRAVFVSDKCEIGRVESDSRYLIDICYHQGLFESARDTSSGLLAITLR